MQILAQLGYLNTQAKKQKQKKTTIFVVAYIRTAWLAYITSLYN